MNNKGVTVVEMIVASALLALAVGSILAFSIQNIKLSRAGEYYYMAVTLAKDRIEEIRKIRGTNGLDYIKDNINYFSNTEYISPEGNENKKFVRTTEINTNYTGDEKLIKITVGVNYEIMKVLRAQPVELVTVLNEKGSYED